METVAAYSPVRSFVKAFAIAMVTSAITFFTGVFLGIVGIAIYAALSHAKVDFSASYRYVAAPSAITAFIAAFITVLVLDIRRANQPD